MLPLTDGLSGIHFRLHFPIDIRYIGIYILAKVLHNVVIHAKKAEQGDVRIPWINCKQFAHLRI